MPFISIEGIDGSGKTEQVKLLVEHLRGNGQSVLQTKEPDGGHLGAEVRAILTHSDRPLAPAEQLLLVSAARFDHVRSVIRPALASGQWVISDRFIDSTYAFQVAVSDADLHLDLPLAVAHGRREQRRDGVPDPAEAARDFAVIRKALIAVAHQEPERCHVIDANQSLDGVARDIWRLVEPLL